MIKESCFGNGIDVYEDELPAKKVCIREESRPPLTWEQAECIVNRLYPLENDEKRVGLTTTCQNIINSSLLHLHRVDSGVLRSHKRINGLPFWIRKQGDEISITFIQNLLSQGGFKKVKVAVGVCVSETIEFSRRVLYRVKGSDIEEVKRGLNMHQEIFSLIDDANRYFVPPPIIHPLYQGKEGREKLEFEAPRCTGTLFDIIKKSPSRIDEGKLFLTPLEIIAGLRNVVLGVEKLTVIGWSHQDLKPNNILVDLNEESISFLISDFDLTVKGIPTNVSEDDRCSYFLNYAARQSLATKETDCYSLAILIAESLIFDFFYSFQGNKSDNEGRLEIYRNLASRDVNISKNLRQEFRTQQVNSLKALFPDASLSLLTPFEDIEEEPSQKEKEDLLMLGASLEASGRRSHLRTAHLIKRFVVGTALENRILSLLGKFLDADLKIEESLDEDSHSDSSIEGSVDDLESFMVRAFERNPFPTIEEIKLLLNDCETETRQILAWFKSR